MLSGSLTINAEAFDPDAGNNDGDGIDNVVFELLQNSSVVDSRQENIVTYDYPLNTSSFAEGTHTLRAPPPATAT